SFPLMRPRAGRSEKLLPQLTLHRSWMTRKPVSRQGSQGIPDLPTDGWTRLKTARAPPTAKLCSNASDLADVDWSFALGFVVGWVACCAARWCSPRRLIAWHAALYRAWWRMISKRRGGRPRINPELIALIRRMARENP